MTQSSSHSLHSSTHAVEPRSPSIPGRVISFELDSPELAQTYDRVGVRQFNHGKQLIAELDPRPGEHVLDVGSGTGLLGAFVASRVAPAGSVKGVDPLPLRVEIAARRAHENGHGNFAVEVGRAEDLRQFAANSFEVVYLNSVFHWIEDKPRALAEIFRVLKPGGRIGLTTGDAQCPHQSARLLREAAEAAGVPTEKLPPGRNLGAVSNAQLKVLFEEAGFAEVQSETRIIVDTLRDAEELFDWSRSSSFGNSLASFEPELHARLSAEVQQRLDTHRKPEGIQLERYLIFATAKKPLLS